MWFYCIAVGIVAGTVVLVGLFLLKFKQHCDDLAAADKLLARTRDYWLAARGTEHEEWLRKRLEVSEVTRRDAVNAYNNCLSQPKNRFPAWLLRIKSIQVEQSMVINHATIVEEEKT